MYDPVPTRQDILPAMVPVPKSAFSSSLWSYYHLLVSPAPSGFMLLLIFEWPICPFRLPSTSLKLASQIEFPLLNVTWNGILKFCLFLFFVFKVYSDILFDSVLVVIFPTFLDM